MPHFEKHSLHDQIDQSKVTASRSGSPERLQQLRKANGFTADGGQGSGSQATSEAPRETASATEWQRKGKGPAPAEGKDRRPVGKDRKPVERLVLSNHYGPENPGLKGGGDGENETELSVQGIAHAKRETIKMYPEATHAISEYAKRLWWIVMDRNGKDALKAQHEMSEQANDWKRDFAIFAIDGNNQSGATTSR